MSFKSSLAVGLIFSLSVNAGDYNELVVPVSNRTNPGAEFMGNVPVTTSLA